jgi:non-homologous end joining protein Ku
MAPRAYWKGHARLSLVAFPVQLYSASSNGGRIAFHQIHRATGTRVRYRKVGPVDDQLALARELVQRKSAPFDPSRFVDHHEAALKELIVAKAGGETVGSRPEEDTAEVIDLMQALKRSLADEQPKKATGRGSAEVRDHPARNTKTKPPTRAKSKPKQDAEPPARRRKSA